MNKKSFFLGFGAGVVVTLVVLFIIGSVSQGANDNTVKYLEQPVSYENKTETSFQVFQVIGNAALANEISKSGYTYTGNTVVIEGENYYNDQILTIKNPQRIGSYSYTTNGGRYLTVPIIDGDISY